MNESLAVGDVQRFGDLLDDADFFEQRHLGLRLLQRLTGDELHGNIGIPGLFGTDRELANLVDLADVGVIERGLQARFAQEAADEDIFLAARTLTQPGMDDLERDQALEARIAGFINRAHSARPQELQDLVALPV